MRRLPLRAPQIASFVLFLGLCASGAYWTLHLMKPRPRAVAAPPPAAAPRVDLAAAGMLFGGAPVAAGAAPSNYQLKGVVAAGSGRSAAIIAIEGAGPALTLGVGGQVAPGLTVREVHPRYVILSENGAARRLDLPEPTGPSSTGGIAPPSGASPVAGPGPVVGISPVTGGAPGVAPPTFTPPATPERPMTITPPPSQPLPAPQPLPSPQPGPAPQAVSEPTARQPVPQPTPQPAFAPARPAVAVPPQNYAPLQPPR